MPWCILDIFDHPNDKVEVFNTLLLDVLNQHVPLKTVRIKMKPAGSPQVLERRWMCATNYSKFSRKIG